MDTPLVREPNWFRVILEEASNRCILDAVVDTLNPEQVIKATALLRKLVAPKVRKPRIKRTCALGTSHQRRSTILVLGQEYIR